MIIHEFRNGTALLLQASTLELNPAFDASAIEQAYEEDPVSASAEFGAQFRSDVESFVSLEAIEACVVPGRIELPCVAGVEYRGFLDFAGGGVGGDSACLAVAHSEEIDGRTIAILDLLREQRPPFSPEETCAEFAATLMSYGVTMGTADRWAGQFPTEQMSKHGVTVTPSEKSKSEIYKDVLPSLNSGTCQLLDVPRLLAQLNGLERRVARGGKDSIDHAPGGHDDVSNAAAGAIVLASSSGDFWGQYMRDYVARDRASA